MKQQEFLALIDDYGINLNQLDILLERSLNKNKHGVYNSGDKWTYFEVNDDFRIMEIDLENEDKAFDKLMRKVYLDLYSKKFINKAITKEIVGIDKTTMIGYLKSVFNLSEKRAEQSFDKLKQDMRILFEMKYYAANGKFVPDEYCYMIEGYTAKDLYETGKLSVLGAYNYLLYLEQNPVEALYFLQAGLPRK